MVYNAEAIKSESGFAPIRSYYCKACGGWHLTSSPLIHKDEQFGKMIISQRSHRGVAEKRNAIDQKLNRIEWCMERVDENLRKELLRKAKLQYKQAVTLYRQCSASADTLCLDRRAKIHVALRSFAQQLGMRLDLSLVP